MYCPRCRTENSERARFCAECGTALMPRCAACGAQVSGQATYCDQCGAHLGGYGAASAADPGERRQLTALFCDLVDFTELSVRLKDDLEKFRQVVTAYQQAADDVIERFEGYRPQLLGDGLLVYFGYPRAHEDDAHRAVRTAMQGTLDDE